jgi:hypothetical protein
MSYSDNVQIKDNTLSNISDNTLDNVHNDKYKIDSLTWFTEDYQLFVNRNFVVALLYETDEEKDQFINFIVENYNVQPCDYITNTTNAYRFVGLNIKSSLKSEKYDVRFLCLNVSICNYNAIINNALLQTLSQNGNIDFIISLLTIKISHVLPCLCFSGAEGAVTTESNIVISILKSVKYLQSVYPTSHHIKVLLLNENKNITNKISKELDIQNLSVDIYYTLTTDLLTDIVELKYSLL